MNDNDEFLAQAFKIFVRFEKNLRRAILADLSRGYGPLWPKKIPSATLEGCEAKRNKNVQAGWGPGRESMLLDYADFSELASIVDYCWDVFKSRFGNKQIVLGRLEEIRLFRNALMHSNMRPEDCPRMIALCEELDSRCILALEQIQLPKERLPGVKVVPEKRVREALAADEEVLAFFEQMKQVLDKMSGRLEGELTALKGYLSQQIAKCSLALLEYVRAEFKELPSTNAIVDELLEALPPAKPSPPQTRWRTRKWISWAVNQYIPYKQWLITHSEHDLGVEEQGREYEEWLYKLYPKMLAHTDKLVFGTYTYIKRELDKGHRVLWVLIDNLSCFWLPILIKALLDNDLVPSQAPVYQLAMLPSETSVSRTSALLGLLPSQITNDDTMAAFREMWHARGITNVHVVSSPNELTEISQYDASLFLFVYNRLDYLAHTPDHQLDDREDEIRFVLSKLASKLSIAVKSLAELSTTRLVISSDHGSTKLYEKDKRLDVPPSAAEDETYKEHRRFIRTSQLDSLNSCDWFALPADRFGLCDDYAIAKDALFISSRPLGYTHGGLTPEETLVPLLIFEPGTLPKLDLHFEQISLPLRPGRPQRLSLLVSNPFPLAVERLEIVLPGYGIRFGPLTVESKTETATEEREIELPPKIPVENGMTYIDLTATFKVGGISSGQTTKLKLKIRQLYVSEIEDFGDMFR
jgi:hypothetical protein